MRCWQVAAGLLATIVLGPSVLVAQVAEGSTDSSVSSDDQPLEVAPDGLRLHTAYNLDSFGETPLSTLLAAIDDLENRDDIRVEIEEPSHRLVIWAAPDADQESLEEVLDKVQGLMTKRTRRSEAADAGDESTRQLHVFSLKQVPAEGVAETLRELYSHDKELRYEVRTSPNQLIVYATPEQIQAISEIVAKAGESARTERQQRVFTLKHPADAKEVVRRFESRFGDDRNWTVAVRHDQIEFHGTEEQIKAAEKLVAELDVREVKIFNLQHADAGEMAALLKELLPVSKLNVAVDARTNSIVATGVAEELNIAHAILLSLDQAGRSAGEEVPAEVTSVRNDAVSADEDSGEETISNLRKTYDAAEKAARFHASDFRRRKEAGDATDSTFQRHRARIKSAVEQAFEIRQRLEAAEVEQLRERLRTIEQRIRQREAIKDEIIERRVEDLLTASQDSPGKVEIEYGKDTDTLILRGAEEDVEAVQGVLEKLGSGEAHAASQDNTDSELKPNPN